MSKFLEYWPKCRADDIFSMMIPMYFYHEKSPMGCEVTWVYDLGDK